MSQALQTWLARLFGVERDEAGAVVAGFAMFFLLFAGYFMLRPVRETMRIVGGVENLQWLFTGTGDASGDAAVRLDRGAGAAATDPRAGSMASSRSALLPSVPRSCSIQTTSGSRAPSTSGCRRSA